MNKRRDNIYIYLWEEFNTIYIGRSVNPKCRHSQHKTRETEKTYQFSSKHHVEHPKMIIIENDLTVEEGVEREKYWIDYYKENTDYFVLNKSHGGETGLLGEYDVKRREEWQKQYYKKNREKILAKAKKYREEHREELNEKDKIRYYKKRKPYQPLTDEEKKIKQKEYRERNKEKIKEYRKNNKEKFLQYKKKYRETHKEKIKEENKKYYAKRKNK